MNNASGGGGGGGERMGADDAWGEDAVKYPLLRALLVAALYPQIVSVVRPPVV